jgi:hypothetical protein
MTMNDETASTTLVKHWEVDVNDWTSCRFAELVVQRGLEHVGTTSWPSEKMTLEGLFDHCVTSQRRHGQRTAVIDLGSAVAEGCLAHLMLSNGSVWLQIAARDVDAVATARAWFRERYPKTEVANAQRVRVAFWSLGQHGPRRLHRSIEVPSWTEVAANYPQEVGRKLSGLLGKEFQPGLGGRLLLWHGPPGTGKTYALRALGWEWRSWCDLHYITDPESFFGASPTYMLDVLLCEDDETEKERWQLLILEDTGELLAADAKERTGQGLSRLLNVVDGMIGQGLRVLVLVTTNERLRTLHAAVSRPGRCASQIEFGAFAADEAAEWLVRHGGEAVRRDGTLAMLYARLEGLELPERPAVGFCR